MVREEPRPETITGVILAGGAGRRMGGRDKGLVDFAGRPLIERVIASIEPQVGALLISANRNRERYGRYGYPVIADRMEGYQGPLAGFAAAMSAARTSWILTLPCDGPFPPPDLAQRLAAALVAQDAEIAVAREAERVQPVYALLPVALAQDLGAFLAAGERRILSWYARHRAAEADFSDRPGCFANVNSTEESRLLARQMLP
jgi:molybdopterin-guanine dinucleotide biosynthesis protein A